MRLLAALLLAALLLAGSVTATIFEPVSTAELVRRAVRVSCVRCEGCKAVRDPRSGLVFTHVRLRLLEDLKGRSAGSTVELRLVGGEADGVRTVVPGMPRFDAGKETVVLLGKDNRAGFPTLLAARRGVLRVGRDDDGKRFLRDRVDGFASLKGKRRVALQEFRAALKKQGKGEGK